MEDEEELMIMDTNNKRKRDEVARGSRKRKMIHCPEKREHSPTVSRRTQNQEGFYSEDWDESKQEEDKWQRISQMAEDFTDGVSWQMPGDKS